MGDDQKIWFIYLTDHHEGPFTPAEIGEKAKQGLVTGQSLVWKDGMPEWVALETIPELQSAMGSAPASAPAADAAPAAAAAAAPATAAEGDFSLAQLLAASQSGTESAAPAVETAAPESASAAAPASSSLSALAALSGTGASATSTQEPAPQDEVWTLKIGAQVSGLHSLERLIQLAGEGEIPGDAMLWRSGWTDFQSVTTVPQVASARKPKRAGTGMTKTAPIMSARGGARSGLAPIVAGANVGDDEATDPSIPAEEAPKGFMAKMKGLFRRKAKAEAAPAAAKAAKVAAPAKTQKIVARSSGGLKKALAGLLVILVIGGGGAAYFLFFMSPLPSDLDVIPADLERMTEIVKTDPGQPSLVIALARGTEDNPADDTSPKFYVATNLPEGTPVTMSLEGQPGTLVNKLRFEKSFTATVNAQKLAVFEEIKDEGKPIPMGEYVMKISAEGAPTLEEKRFLGGKKGAVYERRLKQYKDKLQESYDKEMAELRQFVETLKSLQGEVSRKIAEYKAGIANPALRNKIIYDWKSYSQTFLGLATQFDTKVKERVNATEEKYHPRTYQDIATTLAQLLQLAQLHSARVEGGTPVSSPDELEGLVQASVIGLEQWLASAIVKGPFDVVSDPKTTPASAPGTPPASAAPVPQNAVAPANPVAPAAPSRP